MIIPGGISISVGILLLVAYSIYRGEGGCMRLLLVMGIGVGGAGAAYHLYNRPLNDAHLQPVAWVKKPTYHWPQIVLTNLAKFNGRSGLKGASAFLLKTPRGQVLGATARHLLGEAGGVQPELPVEHLDHLMESWLAYPRTRPSQAIAFSGLGAEGLDSSTLDWLLLKPKEGTRIGQFEALQIRHRPVEIGETVHLIGCPYTDPYCRQQVFSGRVTKLDFGSMFRFSINPPVELSGFSGAPIIDANGHLVGVMTISFEPARTAAGHTEAGGQQVGRVGRLLKH